MTGYHHRPLELAQDSRTLCCVVYVADRLAAEAVKGFRMDLLTAEIDSNVLEQLKLSTGTLEELRKKLPEHLKNAGQVLAQ